MSFIVDHNVTIIGTTVGYVFSASCGNYAFHASMFFAQQLTMSYFCRTIHGLVESWLKNNKRGGGCNKNVMMCIFLIVKTDKLKYASLLWKHSDPGYVFKYCNYIPAICLTSLKKISLASLCIHVSVETRENEQ